MFSRAYVKTQSRGLFVSLGQEPKNARSVISSSGAGLAEVRTPTVYFYCCDEPDNLQEDVIALAEGLRELGVPFFGNCDYWRQSLATDDFLIRHDPDVSHDDCDIVVVSFT